MSQCLQCDVVLSSEAGVPRLTRYSLHEISIECILFEKDAGDSCSTCKVAVTREHKLCP